MILDDSPTFPALFLGAMRMGAVPAPVSFLDTTENFPTTRATPTRS